MWVLGRVACTEGMPVGTLGARGGLARSRLQGLRCTL